MKPKPDFAPTALVVDDQETMGSLMRRTLEAGGFRVMAANNGADALALCRGARPQVDLLVTDYSMPGMSGVELAQECRLLNYEIGVLYVSGSTPGKDLLSDLKPGRRVFLPKPFRPSELLRIAKGLLGGGDGAALGENLGLQLRWEFHS